VQLQDAAIGRNYEMGYDVVEPFGFVPQPARRVVQDQSLNRAEFTDSFAMLFVLPGRDCRAVFHRRNSCGGRLQRWNLKNKRVVHGDFSPRLCAIQADSNSAGG
jgi:hypothetical protein